MFFYLAKALWFVLQPSTLIALLIGYGSILIWTGWARWVRERMHATSRLLWSIWLLALRCWLACWRVDIGRDCQFLFSISSSPENRT